MSEMQPEVPQHAQIVPYSKLFNPSQTGLELQLAISAATTRLFLAMGRIADPLVLQIYSEALSDLPPLSLARAFSQCEKFEAYLPSIGTVRTYTGTGNGSATSSDWTEESLHAWQWLLAYLRLHKPEGKTIGGTSLWDSELGRPGPPSPLVVAPEIPQRTQYACVSMGGTLLSGLRYFAVHPEVVLIKDFDWGRENPEDVAVKKAKEFRTHYAKAVLVVE